MTGPVVGVVHHSLVRGGGSERVVFDLLRSLHARGVASHLLCLYALGNAGEDLEDVGVPVRSKLAKFTWDPFSVFRVARLLRAAKVDVLYVTDGLINMIVGRIAAGLAGVDTTVLGFHSYDTVLRRHATRARRMVLAVSDRVFFPTFDHYIALSPHHADYLVTVKGLAREKVVVIPNGVDVERFTGLDKATSRDRLALGPEEPVACVIAGLRAWKGHDILLRSIAEMKRRGTCPTFLFAGDGPLRESLERTAVELGVDTHVRFLGVVENVPEVLAAADIVVLPSLHEAFPLALLEAMASSRPIVATDIGSVADMLERGKLGVLVQPGDSSQTATAVLGLFQDGQAANRMAAAGRQRVLSKYSVDIMVDRYLDCFLDWSSCSGLPRN